MFSSSPIKKFFKKLLSLNIFSQHFSFFCWSKVVFFNGFLHKNFILKKIKKHFFLNKNLYLTIFYSINLWWPKQNSNYYFLLQLNLIFNKTFFTQKPFSPQTTCFTKYFFYLTKISSLTLFFKKYYFHQQTFSTKICFHEQTCFPCFFQ